MSFHLKKDESIADGLKRVAHEEIESSVGLLRDERTAGRDEAIHEVRKSLKKVRSLLKLVRPGLGEIYSGENAALRQVGRGLSAFRDVAAMLETFDDLKRKYAADLGTRKLSSVGMALAKQKKNASMPEDVPGLLDEMESVLRHAMECAKTWPLQDEGFKTIKPGLKKTYQRGRKALAVARDYPLPGNFHELRKRAKDLLYHVRLIKGLWSRVERGYYEKHLKDLETWLGNDHNLVLLRAMIAADPASYGTTEDTDLVISLIDRYQEELRDNALATGTRLYVEKPGDYVRRMKRLCQGQVGA